MPGSFLKTYAIGGDFLKSGQSNKLDLSIELSLDGFSFLVREEKSILAIERFSFTGVEDSRAPANNLQKIFEEKKFASLTFQNIRVCWFSQGFVFVPNSLFIESEKEKYFGFCNPFQNSINLFHDKIEAIQAYGIYHLPEEVAVVLNSTFPNYEVCHSASAIINWYLKSQNHRAAHQNIFLNIRKSSLEVFRFDEKKLLFYNSFPCKQPSDYIYFLVYLLEQFEVDTSKTKAVLGGEVTEVAEFIEYASSLFQKIETVTPESSAKYYDLINEREYPSLHMLLNL